MTDFRAFCAELAEFVARLTKHYYEPAELLTRARAALADGPASVVSEPSDEEIMELWHGSDWYNEGATLREFLSIARAVLARWGNPPPQPPADGEVAELVEWLREQLHVCLQAPWTPGIKHFSRAANLLERLSPLQPVPVSERLPGPEDCSSDGKCWWFCFECPGEHSYWIFVKEVYCAPTYWLPAHALPLPTAND